MKKLVSRKGGRRLYYDDIDTLQAEAEAAILALAGGFGHDCILTGCAVSGVAGNYTVTPGIVFMGGQILRFLGASGVTLPAALVTSAVQVVNERAYQTGETYPCILEQTAVVSVGSHDGLQLYPTGGFTLGHALRNQVNEVGDVKWGRLATADYDASGKGLPGSLAWGWGLCNGQEGRADLRGKFVAGLNPDDDAYATVGKTGGEAEVTLTLPQIPAHNHGAPDYTATITYASGNSGGNSPNSGKKATVNTGYAGSGQAHNNLPPYYTLAAKQWIGF